jgi:hypothetical protein
LFIFNYQQTNQPKLNNMAKETMKSRVLLFVESQGSARHTDIVRFIVDFKFGEGTYDNTYEQDHNGVQRIPRRKSYRGHYSSAFLTGRRVGRYSTGRVGYFLCGPDRLVKGTDGLYQVLRKA